MDDDSRTRPCEHRGLVAPSPRTPAWRARSTPSSAARIVEPRPPTSSWPSATSAAGPVPWPVAAAGRVPQLRLRRPDGDDPRDVGERGRHGRLRRKPGSRGPRQLAVRGAPGLRVPLPAQLAPSQGWLVTTRRGLRDDPSEGGPGPVRRSSIDAEGNEVGVHPAGVARWVRRVRDHRRQCPRSGPPSISHTLGRATTPARRGRRSGLTDARAGPRVEWQGEGMDYATACFGAG